MRYLAMMDYCKTNKDKCDPKVYDGILTGMTANKKKAEETRASISKLQLALVAAEVREASTRLNKAALVELEQQIKAAEVVDEMYQKILEKAMGLSDDAADRRAYKEKVMQNARESRLQLLALRARYPKRLKGN